MESQANTSVNSIFVWNDGNQLTGMFDLDSPVGVAGHGARPNRASDRHFPRRDNTQLAAISNVTPFAISRASFWHCC